jgi:uncharacterized protein with GYD domain
MPLYMVQAGYTSQALAAMTQNPEDRSTAVRPLIEGAGGKLHSVYFCQGDYDVVVVFEVPNAEAANAIVLAAVGVGHLKTYKTTPLFTPEEIQGAFRKAATLSLRAPGG